MNNYVDDTSNQLHRGLQNAAHSWEIPQRQLAGHSRPYLIRHLSAILRLPPSLTVDDERCYHCII